MTDESNREAFARGEAAGVVGARLSGHDEHFAAINGSISDLAREMHAVVLAVQRLGDQADASARTVIATAQALKEAEDARRGQSEQSWSPLTRISLVVGLLVGLISIAYFLLRP